MSVSGSSYESSSDAPPPKSRSRSSEKSKSSSSSISTSKSVVLAGAVVLTGAAAATSRPKSHSSSSSSSKGPSLYGASSPKPPSPSSDSSSQSPKCSVPNSPRAAPPAVRTPQEAPTATQEEKKGTLGAACGVLTGAFRARKDPVRRRQVIRSNLAHDDRLNHPPTHREFVGHVGTTCKKKRKRNQGAKKSGEIHYGDPSPSMSRFGKAKKTDDASPGTVCKRARFNERQMEIEKKEQAQRKGVIKKYVAHRSLSCILRVDESCCADTRVMALSYDEIPAPLR